MFCALAMRRRVAVALLAEGVDRNFQGHRVNVNRQVALLAEGVDRNTTGSAPLSSEYIPSPSSRRAWIEIQRRWWRSVRWSVALLAEGVDRNQNKPAKADTFAGRPPRGGRG